MSAASPDGGADQPWRRVAPNRPAPSHAAAVIAEAIVSFAPRVVIAALSPASCASTIRSLGQSVQPVSRGLAAMAARGPSASAPAAASSAARPSRAGRIVGARGPAALGTREPDCAGRRRQRPASTSGSAAAAVARPAVNATAPGPAGFAHSAISQQAPASGSSHRSRPRPARPPVTIRATPAATSTTSAATDGPANENDPPARSTLIVTPASTAATTAQMHRRATHSRLQG